MLINLIACSTDPSLTQNLNSENVLPYNLL